MRINDGITHKLADVHEIKEIQVSFLKMKGGLRSFAKYVPSDVVSTLVRGGNEAVLGVDPKTISIFFSDIANFTTICESMQP